MGQSGKRLERARPGKTRMSRRSLRSDIRRKVTKIEGNIGELDGKTPGGMGAQFRVSGVDDQARGSRNESSIKVILDE